MTLGLRQLTKLNGTDVRYPSIANRVTSNAQFSVFVSSLQKDKFDQMTQKDVVVKY